MQLRNVRDHSHAVEHNAGKLAQNQSEGKRRRRQDGWTTDCRGQFASEIGIPHRGRHHSINRSGYRLVFQAPENHPSDIIHVDTAHPLAAIAEDSSETKAKYRKDQVHGAAGADDKADPQANNATSCLRSWFGGGFPSLARLSKKPCSRWRVLRNFLLANIAVVPDSRCVHQDAGTMGSSKNGFNDARRAADTAFQNPPPLGTCPKSQYRFAGKIDYRIQVAQIRISSRRKGSKSRADRPGKRHHFMALRNRARTELAPHIAGGPNNPNA